MNTNLPNSCICYGLYDNNEIIGFCAVLHQPNSKTLNIKRCSRLVILPDYQGIGLGTRFLSYIANYYFEQKYQFTIVTSAKNMIYALDKSKYWEIIRYGKSNKPTTECIEKNREIRDKVVTASFKYIGEQGKIWRKQPRKGVNYDKKTRKTKKRN